MSELWIVCFEFSELTPDCGVVVHDHIVTGMTPKIKILFHNVLNVEVDNLHASLFASSFYLPLN